MKLRLLLALLLAATLSLTLGAEQSAETPGSLVESPELAADDPQAAVVGSEAVASSSTATFPAQPLPWATGPIVQAAEKDENYRGCRVTITCPSGYQLSCRGNFSCSAYPDSTNPCAVICDGFGTLCFPSGC